MQDYRTQPHLKRPGGLLRPLSFGGSSRQLALKLPHPQVCSRRGLPRLVHSLLCCAPLRCKQRDGLLEMLDGRIALRAGSH